MSWNSKLKELAHSKYQLESISHDRDYVRSRCHGTKTRHSTRERVSRFGFVWKIKLCSIVKEVHKFSQSKLVYLLVVVTLLLHSCGEITVVFNGLSILILFYPPTNPFF
jgi:hypothetical protein